MNALQCLSKEWAYKAAGFVSYGGVSAGLRSVQMAKQLVTSLRMMPIAEGVAIPFVGQYLNRETGQFTPAELQHKAATVMLDELLKWSAALRSLRSPN
jgi:NAD(P)H-dependent FMN reductase